MARRDILLEFVDRIEELKRENERLKSDNQTIAKVARQAQDLVVKLMAELNAKHTQKENDHTQNEKM